MKTNKIQIVCGLSLIAASSTMGAVTTSFAHDGTGIGAAPPFLIPGGGANITLAYTIDGAGTVALNASTSSGNVTAVALINQWDNASAGTVANPALFGQSFTLIGTATSNGGTGNYSITKNSGGGLAVQGQNSNRIDGATVPSGALPEAFNWTLTGTVQLDMTSWDYIEAHPVASLNISDANTTFNTGDLNSANNGTTNSGSQSLAGEMLSLSSGDTLSFAVNTVGPLNEGAGLSGFSFDIVNPVPEPSTGLLSILALSMALRRRR